MFHSRAVYRGFERWLLACSTQERYIVGLRTGWKGVRLKSDISWVRALAGSVFDSRVIYRGFEHWLVACSTQERYIVGSSTGW